MGLGGGRLAPRPPLRWAAWQDRRGAVYALALSPDPGERYAAVAGFGLADGAVAVIDRTTGRVVHGTRGELDAKRGLFVGTTVWALAFDPAGTKLAIGTDDGEVWVWRPADGPAALTRLGQHASKDRVLLAWYAPDGRLLTIARSGPAVWWGGGRRDEVELFGKTERAQVVVSRDGRRLVAVPERDGQPVEVVGPDGAGRRSISAGADGYPDCAALSDDGSRLAVGLITKPTGASRSGATDPRVVVYDLTAPDPAPAPGPRLTHFAERLAFAPDGRHLAVAGGDDYDTAVYDLRAPGEAVAATSGPGTGLWGVGLSADGRRVGWQTRRNRAAKGANDGGAGGWQVFDLAARERADGMRFAPTPARVTEAGWAVRQEVDQSAGRVVWRAVGPDGRLHPLVLNRTTDDEPTCYTFVPAAAGRPVRLAVGHYWGWSLFELGGDGARRVRVYSGHAGPVTALAASADGRLVVSASRDQTVAGWSLADWPSHPDLGAKLAVRLERLEVDTVDPGSPAWEAGLTAGDEVRLLAVDGGRFVFKKGAAPGSKWSADPRDGLDKLDRPVPQEELYFRVARAGAPAPLDSSTRVRQRPVWRLFPTRDGEWVVWQPADMAYDASPGGDARIGWVVSGDIGDTPAFHRARDSDGFGVLYRPDRVAAVLADHVTRPDRARVPDAAPPAPVLEVEAPDPAGSGARLTVGAEPRGDREVHRADRAVLWVGDYRFREWKPPGPDFREAVALKPSDLRWGENRITLQVFGRGGGVEKRQVVVTKGGPPPARRLFALLVGVVDYSRARQPGPTPRPWPKLTGVGVDLAELEVRLPGLTKGAFSAVSVTTFQDDRATPQAIQAALAGLKARAGPDDVVLFYLGGHGYGEAGGRAVGGFAFVGPAFDPAAPADTGLTTDALFRGLTGIPAAKVVLLMTCHSGDATRVARPDPVRELTPGGVGPVVLAAAGPTESAMVDPEFGSFFVQAVLKAAEGQPELTVGQLADAARAGTPRLLADAQARDPGRFASEADRTATQTPRVYAPDPAVAGITLFRP